MHFPLSRQGPFHFPRTELTTATSCTRATPLVARSIARPARRRRSPHALLPGWRAAAARPAGRCSPHAPPLFAPRAAALPCPRAAAQPVFRRAATARTAHRRLARVPPAGRDPCILPASGMAMRYIKLSNCGTTASQGRDADDVETAAAVLLVEAKRRWGGSIPGHRTIKRDREGANKILNAQYFVEHPLYNLDRFRRRYRMRESLFLWIVDKVTEADSYFKQKRNCAGQLGFSPMHKCMIAIKMLAYGSIADSLDEHVQMGESTILETLKRFVRTIVNVFGEEWIRPPSGVELQQILKDNEARGFPGMIGSIDCMHWEWSSCPTALHGMYKGHKGKPTVILEAVATEDLRFWHVYFGLPGSHNDINVLQRSPVFDDLANGRAHPVEFTVNGNIYNMGYYLADGIYPDWATLIKTISAPISNKHKVYAQRQEACRKDVERAFGVVQAKWKILHSPARLWHQEDLNYIMRACIILHNMIIMDEKGLDLPAIHASEWPGRENPPVCNIAEFIDAQTYIRNKETCHHLRTDLIEHIWGLYGSGTGPFAPNRSI